MSLSNYQTKNAGKTRGFSCNAYLIHLSHSNSCTLWMEKNGLNTDWSDQMYTMTLKSAEYSIGWSQCRWVIIITRWYRYISDFLLRMARGSPRRETQRAALDLCNVEGFVRGLQLGQILHCDHKSIITRWWCQLLATPPLHKNVNMEISPFFTCTIWYQET